MSTLVPPTLKDGEKEAVLVTQDESTFYCNGKKKLLPKSKGFPISVKDLCPQQMVQRLINYSKRE
jgi:hypothetical protein